MHWLSYDCDVLSSGFILSALLYRGQRVDVFSFSNATCPAL